MKRAKMLEKLAAIRLELVCARGKQHRAVALVDEIVGAIETKGQRKFAEMVYDWFPRKIARMSGVKTHHVDGDDKLAEYGFAPLGASFHSLQRAIAENTGKNVPLSVLSTTTIDGIMEYIIHGGAQ